MLYKLVQIMTYAYKLSRHKETEYKTNILLNNSPYIKNTPSISTNDTSPSSDKTIGNLTSRSMLVYESLSCLPYLFSYIFCYINKHNSLNTFIWINLSG